MTPAAKEEATVYRSLSGRRFFTLRGALRSSAWALVRKRCECEDAEFDVQGMTYPGYTCSYCMRFGEDPTKGEKIVGRLVRRWMRKREKS